MRYRFLYSREKKARIQSRLSGAKRSFLRSGYTTSILLASIPWLAAIFLLQLSEDLRHPPLLEGQRAPATIIAEVDFESKDLAASDLARRREMDRVLPVFTINEAGLRSSLRKLDQVFDRLLELRTMDTDLKESPIELPVPSLSSAQIERLAPEGKEETVRSAIREAVSTHWAAGIISISEKDSRFHGVAGDGAISIALNDQPLRTPVEINDLHTPENATLSAMGAIRDRLDGMSLSQHALQSMVRALIQPNLTYDAARTNSSKQRLEQLTQPIYKQVRAGDTIINQGDRVRSQQLEDWRAHEQQRSELQSPLDRRLQWIGRSFLLLFAFVICSGLLQIVRPDVVRSPRHVLLLVILCLLTLLSVVGLLYLANTSQFLRGSLVEFMLPLSFAPLLATILIGPATAVVVGAWTSFTAAVMFDNSFSIFAMGLLVTIIVAHIARKMRTRSRMVRIGLWIGIAQTLYGLSLAVLSQVPVNLMGVQVGVALLNGIVSALLALLLLPLFESLFDITTDISLLELSDMGHPLLQRLAMEAPGTYHHSLMVSNLAQSAAEKVNANALLVRVCAYFHDIGKLTKPEYFAENIHFTDNPHDDLTPSMSALVIIAHVKEGVSMARRAKLPSPLIDAIQQHHGTGMVSYFYHQAKQERKDLQRITTPAAGRERGIEEADYRYPGPKPSTTEMGILLLADSVEAASRSMEKPTPSRIENLVNDIVDARMKDHQLDDCALTFAQLKVIKETFIFTLTNMLHGRVPYPKDEDRNNQPTTTVPDSDTGA